MLWKEGKFSSIPPTEPDFEIYMESLILMVRIDLLLTDVVGTIPQLQVSSRQGDPDRLKT